MELCGGTPVTATDQNGNSHHADDCNPFGHSSHVEMVV